MMVAGGSSVSPSLGRLPGRLTPFIGRLADLHRAQSLLDDPSVRLVTILGLGGVGKTALALELARRLLDSYEHGAVFVPLGALSSVDELLPALAEALDVQLPPSGDLQQLVLDHLSGLQVLIVLDSFEHLLPEAILVRDLLLAAPRLKVIVTSREKLNLEAECLYTLGGMDLPLPDGLQPLEQYDSVSLFLQRARQARPGFALTAENAPDVVALCRMVDGNPLGILLAASGVEHFSPAEIARQAGSSLDFLTQHLRDMEPRHSSLRAVFESSFRRLEQQHQAVFRRCSIFRGGFDLPAAQAVTAAALSDLLALTEKSMLARDLETGRYDLHGLLHQYAREKLDAAGEQAAIQAAHTGCYCEFVRAQEPRLMGGTQPAALDAMQADIDNIRQAWADVIVRRDFDLAASILPVLYGFCDMRNRFYEGEAIFRQAAEGLAPDPGAAAHPVWPLALLSWFDMYNYIERFESYESITAQAHTCLQQFASTGEAAGIAASLTLLGTIAQHQGDFKTAVSRYEEAMRIWPHLDDFHWVNMRIGLAYQADRQYDRAIEAFKVSLARGRRTGEQVKTGWSLQNIGDVLAVKGELSEAVACLEQALRHFQDVGSRTGVLWASASLAGAALRLGQRDRARELAQVAAAVARQIHSASWITRTDDLLRLLDPRHPAAPDAPRAPVDDSLSQREAEVLQLLKSELTGPEIARQLVVSLNTVRFHTRHIYQKLGVNNRLEAIRRARELGL